LQVPRDDRESFFSKVDVIAQIRIGSDVAERLAESHRTDDIEREVLDPAAQTHRLRLWTGSLRSGYVEIELARSGEVLSYP
jgi:hypothetical protein